MNVEIDPDMVRLAKIKEVNKKTLGEVYKQPKYGKPSDPVLEVVFDIDDGPVHGRNLRDYIRVSKHPKSNLQRFRRRYGDLPKPGMVVEVYPDPHYYKILL